MSKSKNKVVPKEPTILKVSLNGKEFHSILNNIQTKIATGNGMSVAYAAYNDGYCNFPGDVDSCYCVNGGGDSPTCNGDCFDA